MALDDYSVTTVICFLFWAVKEQVSSFKKFSGGGVVVVVVVVACLIIVSTPGPDFVRVKARFGKFGSF